MRSQENRRAAHGLLRTAAIVPYTVTAHQAIPGNNEGELALAPVALPD